jgi:hypothetical protein
MMMIRRLIGRWRRWRAYRRANKRWPLPLE